MRLLGICLARGLSLESFLDLNPDEVNAYLDAHHEYRISQVNYDLQVAHSLAALASIAFMDGSNFPKEAPQIKLIDKTLTPEDYKLMIAKAHRDEFASR